MKKKSLTTCPICSEKDIIFRDRFYVCKSCGYETAGIKNSREIDSYYNADDVGLKVQNILEEEHDSPLRKYHKKAITVLSGKKKLKTICDIGCGVGVLLKEMRKDKYDVYGYDINEEQTLIARKKYNLKNVGYAESLAEYCKKKRIKKGFFDAITAFEVIEHIPEVNAFVNEADHYLKKGGILIISTPNSKRLPMHESWDYPPIHLSRFNKKNMEILLKKHHFKLLSWTSYNELGYYSNNFIHKQAFSKKMLSTMVNSQQSNAALTQQLNFIASVKKLACFFLDIPVFLLLSPFKGRGHTMFVVAQKIS